MPTRHWKSDGASRTTATRSGPSSAVWSVFLLGAATSMSLPAQTLTTLHRFNVTNGEYAEGALVQGTDGDFYGTTNEGGANGVGTVFKITPGGVLTTLYSFCVQTACADGSFPAAGLVQATNGTFYGTTGHGGAAINCPQGCGTVFKITANGKLTTLHTFCSQACDDGAYPFGGLVQAANGALYGSTVSTVFKITPAGGLTTLHTFNSAEGSNLSGLIQATNGDFYGTAESGGAHGYGTVFKITPAGGVTTLYSFCSESGCPDGGSPVSALVQATNADFYGTTPIGGIGSDYDCSSGGCGTVFSITPAGKLTTLYSFCTQNACADGARPLGALVQSTDGSLFGVTYEGGVSNPCPYVVYLYGCGTIFKITPAGALSTVYTFLGSTDGALPGAGLVQATNGNFYGTTGADGTTFGGSGTFFRLSVGLTAFVETHPTSGKVDTIVKILGNNLSGTTSVTFNGTAAVFKVVSSSEITATVPSGASTGMVQVVTPSSTLSSNVPFRVLP